MSISVYPGRCLPTNIQFAVPAFIAAMKDVTSELPHLVQNDVGR
jgi:hypothetical protein